VYSSCSLSTTKRCRRASVFPFPLRNPHGGCRRGWFGARNPRRVCAPNSIQCFRRAPPGVRHSKKRHLRSSRRRQTEDQEGLSPDSPLHLDTPEKRKGHKGVIPKSPISHSTPPTPLGWPSVEATELPKTRKAASTECEEPRPLTTPPKRSEAALEAKQGAVSLAITTTQGGTCVSRF